MPFQWLALKNARLLHPFWNYGNISIVLASSGSFNVKNDNIHTFFCCFGCKFWICWLRSKTKLHGLETVRTAKSWPRKNQSGHSDLRLRLRLRLPYNNTSYFQSFGQWNSLVYIRVPLALVFISDLGTRHDDTKRLASFSWTAQQGVLSFWTKLQCEGWTEVK